MASVITGLVIILYFFFPVNELITLLRPPRRTSDGRESEVPKFCYCALSSEALAQDGLALDRVEC